MITMKRLTFAVIPVIALAAGLGLAACGSRAAPSAAPTRAVTPAPASTTPVPTTPAAAPVRTVYVPAAPATRAAPALTDCGNYLYVNADTSCSFAQNVEADYTGLGPDYASSPMTGLNYTMNCVAGTDNEGDSGHSVECTGGNNAYVMWPAN
jgi:hypothetical protein